MCVCGRKVRAHILDGLARMERVKKSPIKSPHPIIVSRSHPRSLYLGRRATPQPGVARVGVRGEGLRLRALSHLLHVAGCSPFSTIRRKR